MEFLILVWIGSKDPSENSAFLREQRQRECSVCNDWRLVPIFVPDTNLTLGGRNRIGGRNGETEGNLIVENLVIKRQGRIHLLNQNRANGEVNDSFRGLSDQRTG